MAGLLKVEVTKEELDRCVLPMNTVLCQMFYDSENMVSKGGLLIGFNKDVNYTDIDNPDDTSSRPADLAETCALVKKVPLKLYYDKEESQSMPWLCDMELQEGDLVWTNPIETLNAVCMVCEGTIYKFIPYQELYCARRNIILETEYFMADNDKPDMHGYVYYNPKMKFRKERSDVIMLNGYVLCEQVNKPRLSEWDITNSNVVDKTRGIVAFIGKPNQEYQRDDYIDFEGLQVGDEILFDQKYAPFLLERTTWASKFDSNKLYWVVPRYRIAMILNRK